MSTSDSGHAPRKTLLRSAKIHDQHSPSCPDMNAQPCRLWRTTRQVATPPSEFYFEVVPNTGIKVQTADAFWRNEAVGTYKTPLLGYIPKLVVSLDPDYRHHSDEHDARTAEKYCVCESSDSIFVDPQNGLAAAAVTMRAKTTHIFTDKAPKFGRIA